MESSFSGTFLEVCKCLSSYQIKDLGQDGIGVIGPGGCLWSVDPNNPHLGGDCFGQDGHYEGDLWPWLIQRFSPSSMLDVGCSEGAALAFFAKKGVRTCGIEGLQRSVEIARKTGQRVIQHDLVKPLDLDEQFDLVWCSDVIEHIEDQYKDNFLRLFQLGKVLAITHGTEAHGNCGWHHVNNRSCEYWIETIEAYGFKLHEELTQLARARSHSYFKLYGKIFLRTG